jgi:uncharacterized membrane protein YdjX (TVP38/TMEM64 family)
MMADPVNPTVVPADAPRAGRRGRRAWVRAVVLVAVLAGALLGYYGVFCFVRWGGREWVLHRWPKLRRLSEGLKDYGIGGVFLVRQVPVHGSLTNLALGLSGVRHYQFLIGSGIGLLPEAIPAALIGAGLVSGSFEKAFPYLAGAAVGMGALWVGVGVALRRIRRGRAGVLLVGDAGNGAGHADQSVLR